MKFEEIIHWLDLVFKWLNLNQGVVSVGVFFLTIIFGWVSGIFGALRKKPKFKIKPLPGPTFCCTFPTGGIYEEFDIHRTGIALYLRIANVGSSASSIENISVAYHWNLNKINILWIKYCLGWFWIDHPCMAIEDFKVEIGDNIKFYPFLLQRSVVSGEGSNSFFEPGKSENGVVYFEQDDSFGGCFPKSKNGLVLIKVRILDTQGKCHEAKFHIPSVSLNEAIVYNPSFGATFFELRKNKKNHDESLTSQ